MDQNFIKKNTEMYCYDLEVMSSNASRVELGVLRTSALSRT